METINIQIIIIKMLLRGKNDRMKEYEKERLKHLNNQNHIYNYRNYVKK